MDVMRFLEQRDAALLSARAARVRAIPPIRSSATAPRRRHRAATPAGRGDATRRFPHRPRAWSRGPDIAYAARCSRALSPSSSRSPWYPPRSRCRGPVANASSTSAKSSPTPARSSPSAAGVGNWSSVRDHPGRPHGLPSAEPRQVAPLLTRSSRRSCRRFAQRAHRCAAATAFGHRAPRVIVVRFTPTSAPAVVPELLEPHAVQRQQIGSRQLRARPQGKAAHERVA